VTGLLLSVLLAIPVAAVADDRSDAPVTTAVEAAAQRGSPDTTARTEPAEVAQATTSGGSVATASAFTGGLPPPESGGPESPASAPESPSASGAPSRTTAAAGAQGADRLASRTGPTTGAANPAAPSEGDAAAAEPVPEDLAAPEPEGWPAPPLAEPELVVAAARQRSTVLPLALLFVGLVLTALSLLTRRRQATVSGR